MGRILGRVEYGREMPARYFIHCNTSGASFQPLFASSEQAWHIYDREKKASALEAAVPKQSTLIFAIRKVLAHGRTFDEDGTIYGAVFGLASEDRLLWPFTDDWHAEDSWSLLRVGTGLHVAVEEDGGFSGWYDKPICEDRRNSKAPGENEQRLTFEQMFGQKLNLCPQCAARLLGLGLRQGDAVHA